MFVPAVASLLLVRASRVHRLRAAEISGKRGAGKVTIAHEPLNLAKFSANLLQRPGSLRKNQTWMAAWMQMYGLLHAAFGAGIAVTVELPVRTAALNAAA